MQCNFVYLQGFTTPRNTMKRYSLGHSCPRQIELQHGIALGVWRKTELFRVTTLIGQDHWPDLTGLAILARVLPRTRMSKILCPPDSGIWPPATLRPDTQLAILQVLQTKPFSNKGRIAWRLILLPSVVCVPM